MTLDTAFKLYNSTKKDNQNQISGLLGTTISGIETVKHPTRKGYVYVRLHDNSNEVIVARNDKVSPAYGLPVLIQRSGNTWRVVDRDIERYIDWGTNSSFLPPHAGSHSFSKDTSTGGDMVFIYPDQYMPLLATPSGTSGSGNVIIHPYTLQKDDGSFVYVGNTGTQSLLPYVPTGNWGVMALIYLNTDTGNPEIAIDTNVRFPGALNNIKDLVSYIPSVPNSAYIPIYAVRLVKGMTVIGWNNLYNLRQFMANGAIVDHESLTGLLGGTPNNHYHLTPAQIVGLVSGTSTALHSHPHGSDAPYDSSLFTGTVWADLTDGGENTLHYHPTGTVLHESLSDLYGGLPGNHHHLTAAQITELVSGTNTSIHSHNYQPLDSTLTSIASLGTALGKMLYTTDVDTWAEAEITAAGRALIDDVDIAAMRATLGLVSGGSGDIWLQKTGGTLTGELLINSTADTEITLGGTLSGSSQFGIYLASILSGSNVSKGLLFSPQLVSISANGFYGIDARPIFNVTSAGTMPAYYGLLGIPTIHANAIADVSAVYAGYYRVDNLSTAGAEIGEAIGVLIASPTETGVVGSKIGLRIQSMGSGYSVYTDAGTARFGGAVNTTSYYQVDGVQVVGNRIVDSRIDDTVGTTWNSTTAGVLDAVRDSLITHGLIAAS